jgi:hypothetical protein
VKTTEMGEMKSRRNQFSVKTPNPPLFHRLTQSDRIRCVREIFSPGTALEKSTVSDMDTSGPGRSNAGGRTSRIFRERGREGCEGRSLQLGVKKFIRPFVK